MGREQIVGVHVDPDFGKLALVEERFRAGVGRGPLEEHVMRWWRSADRAAGPEVRIDDEGTPPQVIEVLRAAFRGIVADPKALKARVARDLLDDAVSWADSGDIEFEATEAGFAKLLSIDSFSFGAQRLTVWMSESADIFAGHVIEVRIEGGEISEICIAG